MWSWNLTKTTRTTTTARSNTTKRRRHGSSSVDKYTADLSPSETDLNGLKALGHRSRGLERRKGELEEGGKHVFSSRVFMSAYVVDTFNRAHLAIIQDDTSRITTTCFFQNSSRGFMCLELSESVFGRNNYLRSFEVFSTGIWGAWDPQSRYGISRVSNSVTEHQGTPDFDELGLSGSPSFPLSSTLEPTTLFKHGQKKAC